MVSCVKEKCIYQWKTLLNSLSYESYAEASGTFLQKSDYIPTQMETQNSIMKKRTGEVRLPSDNKAKN